MPVLLLLRFWWVFVCLGVRKHSYLLLEGKGSMESLATFLSLWWGPSQDTVQIFARLKGVTFWSNMGPHQSPGKGLKGRRGASDSFGKQRFCRGCVVGATGREECALFSGQRRKISVLTIMGKTVISITGRRKFFSPSSNLSIVEIFFRCPCVL